jgi:hypothetical protein
MAAACATATPKAPRFHGYLNCLRAKCGMFG